jgi:TatD DNase family protein
VLLIGLSYPEDFMALVDTHVHIPLMIDMALREPTKEERHAIESLVREARALRVERMITIGTSVHDSMQNVAIAQLFPEIYASIGIHPTDITEQWREDTGVLKDILCDTHNSKRVVAIGECGIDLYHTSAGTSPLKLQEEVFYVQLELALEHNLPVVVHSRNAAHETLMCLDKFSDTNLRGIIHCFSYDAAIAQEFLQRNFVLGIGGTVTYPKNEELRDIVRAIAPSEFVYETDAPFLPPQPWRGKKNYPHHVAYIAEYCAGLRNVSVEELADVTTRTVERIFTHLGEESL